MSKKQTSQSVGVQQQGSSLSTLAESDSNNQLPLPAINQECPLCLGVGVVDDGDEKITCPQCQPAQATEGPAMAPVCAVASATVASGQTCQPATQRNSGQARAFGGAEQQCPNCQGKRLFTEQVRNEEGQMISATISCGRCNGFGYIIVPLCSPILAQEEAMTPEWPKAEFEINWPWSSEPDPVIGTIVGWNWVTKEVAVVTKQPQYLNMKPWKVTIDLQPMPKSLLSCIVLGVDEPVVHKDPVWYTTWTRTGEKQNQLTESADSFFGRCLVQELA